MKRSWIPLGGMCLCLATLTSLANDRAAFVFREPDSKTYHVETKAFSEAAAKKAEWLPGTPSDSTNVVEFGSTIVLHLKNPRHAFALLQKSPLTVSREVAPGVLLLRAPDAATALREANRLSALPEVSASYPVARRPASLDSAYAARPNDTYFFVQWYLENRSSNGTPAGVDLNVRSAWPTSRGENITVAVADLGIELNHPELSPRANPSLHTNFYYSTTNALPPSSFANAAHGTEVSGLILAEQQNNRGMSGVAPLAQLASWVIVASNGLMTTEDRLMDMYQSQSNTVAVQNHSWSRGTTRMQRQSILEEIGISNAVTFGRNGRGVIIVRSAGNDRSLGANANDDAATSDPRAIAVAAVRGDGRFTSYSEPGASVLVGAPSGDTGFSGLFTTDLLGTRGVNQINFGNDLNDYVFNELGFSGTSASSPLVAGIASLILGANTNLSYRDVQQILALSSRHFFFNDPDIATNGAGLVVSHNIGYGIPDAGLAVRTARSWPTRPTATAVALTASNLNGAIPDAGLRVLITGDDVPEGLASLEGAPTVGAHPDIATAVLPLVDIGFATNIPAVNLTNKAALIQRGTNSFEEKINNAAAAGAAFAVIYDNVSVNPLFALGGTDLARIPAAGITQSQGEALRSRLQSNLVTEAKLALSSFTHTFAVTNTLICEHAGLRVSASHPARGDLRITLLSPQGTRSVLQRLNVDTNTGPTDWTYYSTHHFLESSAGQWTVAITDEFGTGVGVIDSLELKLSGVPITDSDQDGLDDAWETTHFGSLGSGPKDDSDKDGYNNAREQVMGTDPNLSLPLGLNLSRWSTNLFRLSWPASRDFAYEVWSGTNVANLTLRTNLAGQFPEGEWFVTSGDKHHFLRIVAQPAE